jgi:DNA invertase Pin-like site-specific DNA recombinase
MSTKEQLAGDSLRRQLERSKEYAERNGLELIERDQLADIGISAFKGRNAAEGNLKHFLDAVEAGRIAPGTTLIIESLDRLSRDKISKATALFLNIINAGIRVVTFGKREHIYTEESLDTGDLMLSIVELARANEESEMKSDRLKEKWKVRRANASSKRMTSLAPGWLKPSRDGKGYEVIKDRAAIVRSIYTDSANGIGQYSITRRLNQSRIPPFGNSEGWQKSYVQKLLNNPATIGVFQPKNAAGEAVGEPIKKYYPPIIDSKLFHRVQAGMKSRATHAAGRKGPTYSNLFQGLAKCAYCQGTMRYENKGATAKHGGSYLVCDNAVRGRGCPAPVSFWSYPDFQTSFLTFVTEVDLEAIVAAGSKVEASARAALAAEIQALQGKLLALAIRSGRLVEAIEGGNAPATVLERIAALEDETTTTKALLAGKERDLANRNANGNSLRDGQKEIKNLLVKMGMATADDRFRLRSAIADRLRSIVSAVWLSTNGRLDRPTFPYFTVGFWSGGARVVTPDPADPSKAFEGGVAEPDGDSLKVTWWDGTTERISGNG